MGMGSNVLDTLDAEILKCIGREDAQDMLVNLYIDFWRALKERVGTSRGFDGLSEYLVFRYVLKFIERRSDIEFASTQCTQNTCIFESRNLLLTRDVPVSQFDPNAPRQKTDIALFVRENETNRWQIVSAFEIKIGFSSREVLDDMIHRFSILLGCSQALVFPVVFNSLNAGPQQKASLDAFCASSKGRAFVISKTYANNMTYELNIGLNEAIEKSLALALALRDGALNHIRPKIK